jgi:hypothetical protein
VNRADFDEDMPTTEFLRPDERTTPFWQEARVEWAQQDNTETKAATPRAKERR